MTLGEQSLTAWAYNFKISLKLLGFKGLSDLIASPKKSN